MADIRPFSCIRPSVEYAKRVAALPYDVFSREEALKEVEEEPLSFLKIDRAETQFSTEVSMYDDKVYEKAKDILEDMIQEGILFEDEEKCYYIYELIMEGRHQTGIVAVASIDDYINHTIKTHEETREEKELDRIKHVNICNAQTGPIFLTYRYDDGIHNIIESYKQNEPLYSFEAKDHITHNIWKLNDNNLIRKICEAFQKISSIYIADGHHRAASAVKVGLMRREHETNVEPISTIDTEMVSIEEKTENHNDLKELHESNENKLIQYRENPIQEYKDYNYFLSVLFPDNELMIYPYYRIVKDLNGLKVDEFLNQIRSHFDIEYKESNAYIPDKKTNFGLLVEDKWYKLMLKEDIYRQRKKESILEPEKLLDVSILQDYILGPILDIKDPRIDKRIDFVGGIRGISELQKRTNADMKAAFTLYPTSIEELFEVSDSNKRMPPKSTWFEPKLRSGLFIHRII